jgi:Mn2+/Fe2+ NRAMP family transporter
VDPTTVGTLSVIGSTTRYSLAWLAVLLIPLLTGVQVIASRVGVVTGCDLQQVVVSRFGRLAQLVLLVSVVPVNVFTLAADLAAGGAALELLTGIGWRVWTLPLAVAVLALLLAGGFDEVQKVLQYVILVLLSFGAAAILAHPDWGAVLHGTFVPKVSFEHGYVTAALALLGTTLTSYVYIWQSIQAAEGRPPLTQLRTKTIQSTVGVLVAVVIFWFILIATAATLGEKGIRVDNSQEAARALQPVAGPVAVVLFAVGMLASTLLAVPILAAATAYVVGAGFDWRRGLSEPVRGAPRFYLVLAVTLTVSVVSIIAGIEPIRLLFLASLAGGLGTPVSLGFLIIVARDRALMGDHRIPGWLAIAGWIFVAVITAISVLFLVQSAM